MARPLMLQVGIFTKQFGRDFLATGDVGHCGYQDGSGYSCAIPVAAAAILRQSRTWLQKRINPMVFAGLIDESNKYNDREALEKLRWVMLVFI